MPRHTPISAAAMARAGWRRTDPRPWRKTSARWQHDEQGWRLVHCGHPTALWPWALYDAEGDLHINANGKAWEDLASAVAFVQDGARFRVRDGVRCSLVPYYRGRALRALRTVQS